MTYKAVIIGLGRIGALNDLNVPAGQVPLTHLRAISQNSDFEIVALVDTDHKKHVQIAQSKNSHEDLFHCEIPDIKADIYVFATPPHDRLKDLQSIIKNKPKCIIFEKPLALSVSEAQEIKNLCAENNIVGIVNFHRRYDEDHQRFHRALPAEMPQSVIFHYCKGLLNYGSHGIDLIQSWFGEIKKFQALSGIGDEIDAFLELASGTKVHMISHKNEYDMFDFEFFYKDQKYSLLQGGILKTRQDLMPNPYHAGYMNLGPAIEIMPPRVVSGLENLYKEVAKICENPKYLIKGCGLKQAVDGLKIIEGLVKS